MLMLELVLSAGLKEMYKRYEKMQSRPKLTASLVHRISFQWRGFIVKVIVRLYRRSSQRNYGDYELLGYMLNPS